MSKRILLSVLGAALLALLLTGCSDDPSPTAAPTAETVPSPIFTATPASANTPISISTSAPTPVPTAAPATAPTVAPEPTPLPTAAAVDPAVDGYLAQLDCASSEESINLDEEDVTYGDFSALIEEQIAQLEVLIPPAELTAFHQSMLEPLQALKGVSDQQPQDAEVDFAVIFGAVWEVLEGLEAQQMDLLHGISTPTLQRMADAGCIEQEDVPDDHANEIADATTAMVGTPIQGVIDWEGDPDSFRFAAEEGQIYRIEVEPGTLPNVSVLLAEAVPVTVFSVSTIGASPLEFGSRAPESAVSYIQWKASESGDYYIVVRGAEDSHVGSYTLTIHRTVDDHADSSDGATTIQVGATDRGIMDHAADVDYFRFTAEENLTYQIELAPDSIDSCCWSYDLSNVEGLVRYMVTEPLIWQAEESGDYYIGVEASYADGGYTLTVTELVDDHANTLAEATPIVVGMPVEGVIDSEVDSDFFCFTAEEGRFYEVDVAPGTLTDYWTEWYDDEGVDIVSGDFWTTEYSGRHCIELSSFLGGNGQLHTDDYSPVGESLPR